MVAVGAVLFLMIILGSVTKSVIMPKNKSQKNIARTETAYEDLKSQLVPICQERNCTSVKRLTYQKTEAFDVTSYILLTDGSVYQCNYNLKSCQGSVFKTDYTEVQINQMKEKQLQEEQQKLEQEQKAEKKM